MCIFAYISLIQTEAVQCELHDYLLLDLQGVHVVVALHCVLLRVSLGINEHVVFVPWRQQKDNWFILTVVLRVCIIAEGCECSVENRFAWWRELWMETSLWHTHDWSASHQTLVTQRRWSRNISYQAILGLGHPATVQCSLTFLPSQTVCPRGFTINSGGCVRLSGFIFLRNSAHSSIYRKRAKPGICHIELVSICRLHVREFKMEKILLLQIQKGVKRIYRLAQLQALGRFSDMRCSGFLLHPNLHSLPGLPDKQVPHGHIVNPLLWYLLLLGLHQTANNFMTGAQQTTNIWEQFRVKGPIFYTSLVFYVRFWYP